MILDPESELESDFLSLFTPNSGRLISFGITGADFMGGIGSTGGFDTTTAADLCEIYVNVTHGADSNAGGIVSDSGFLGQLQTIIPIRIITHRRKSFLMNVITESWTLPNPTSCTTWTARSMMMITTMTTTGALQLLLKGKWRSAPQLTASGGKMERDPRFEFQKCSILSFPPKVT